MSFWDDGLADFDILRLSLSVGPNRRRTGSSPVLSSRRKLVGVGPAGPPPR
jgi:hypothetical protein